MEPSQVKQVGLNQESISLYEEVVAKNFQIIENSLTRFHAIFTKQQQLEDSLKKVELKLGGEAQKMEEIYSENKKINQRMEKKLSSMKSLVLQSLANQKIKDEERSAKFQQSINEIKSMGTVIEVLEEKQRNIDDQIFPKYNNFEFQINSIQDRLNSLSSVIVSKNEQRLTQEDFNKMFINSKHTLMIEINEKIQSNLKTLQEKLCEQGSHLYLITEEIKKGFEKEKEEIDRKMKKIDLEMGQKVSIAELKSLMEKMGKKIGQVEAQYMDKFAYKEETKKVLLLFEKKLNKLQLLSYFHEEKEKEGQVPMIQGHKTDYLKPNSRSEIATPKSNSVMKMFGKKKS